MHRFKKISTRIFLGIFAGTILVFSLSSLTDYFYSRNILSKLVRNLVEKTFLSAYNEIESEFNSIINLSQNSAFYVLNYPMVQDDLKQINQQNFDRLDNRLIRTSCYLYVKEQRNIICYTSNDDSTHRILDSSEFSVDKDFLLKPEKEPQRFPIQMVIKSDTISLFYYAFGAKLNVCFQYDYNLNRFIDILNAETRLFKSRHYLFDQNNQPIRSSTEKFSSIDESIILQDIAVIQSYLDQGLSGLIVPKDTRDPRALYILELKKPQVTMVTSVLIDEVLRKFRVFFQISFVISFFAIILLAYVLQRIIIRLTKPITELTDISKRIQEGGLNVEVPEYNGSGETAQLSDALRSVQFKMRRYVSDLNSTLRQKRALEHELKIANKIQADMIPDPYQALTDIPEIDLYAKMNPAKGVAGDFYDYFFLNRQELFFVIGDVSGKGIPAALFMVKAITLFELGVRNLKDPAKVFNAMNENLCLRNDEGMFVTAICGKINIQSGEIVLCDAGHNIPFFSAANKEFEYHDIIKGRPLGMIENSDYRNTTMRLKEGETFLLYTDGFPECVGKNDSMLGEDRMASLLKSKSGDTLTGIANTLWISIDEFRQGTPSSDDTTLLLIRYLGKSAE